MIKKSSLSLAAFIAGAAMLPPPAHATIQSLARGEADFEPGVVYQVAVETDGNTVRDIYLAKQGEAPEARNIDFTKAEIDLIPELPRSVLTMRAGAETRQADGSRVQPIRLRYSKNFAMTAVSGASDDWATLQLELRRPPNSPELVLMYQGKRVRSVKVLTKQVAGKPWGIEAVSIKTL